MPLSFPSSPTVGQTSAQNGRTYTWIGSAWDLATNVATHASSHSASGGDPIAIAASQVTSGTLADARLSANVPLLPGMLLKWSQPTGTVDVVTREDITASNVTATSGTVLLTYFTPLVSLTITQIAAISGNTAGSGLTLARMGLYTVADDQNVTLVARTANDTTLFAATNTTYTRSLDTTGGYPASYSLVAGTRYAVGVIVVGTTVPNLAGKSGNAYVWGITPRISGQRLSQTDLATLTSVSVSGTYAFFRLS